MKFIKEYNQFIFEEVSKNEPIPEIIGVDRGLAVFLIGAPGIGKSYFVKNRGAGKEFTDKGFEHIKEIFDKAKENKYKIIFIHLLSTLETSIKQDELRDRHVDPHYIQWAYAKQQGGEIDGQKVEGNIQRYKALNPDAYYLVTSIDKKYKFYKFIDGKLAVRKNDRYVIKESVDNKDVTSQIVDTMLDFIDDGYNIKFISNIGSMTYQQYLDGPTNFQPQVKMSSGVLVSQFTIRFTKNEKFKSYEDFVRICDEMQVTIARLSDMGWSFAKFNVNSFEGNGNDESTEAKFNEIEFKFKKKDEKSGERKFDTNEFRANFEHHTRLHILDVKEYDDSVYVEFDSIDYDGELPRNTDDRLERVKELYGFATVDYRWPNKYVYFFWED